MVLSCEICKIFKNNVFHRTPRVAASEQTRKSLWFIVWRGDTLVI